MKTQSTMRFNMFEFFTSLASKFKRNGSPPVYQTNETTTATSENEIETSVEEVEPPSKWKRTAESLLAKSIQTIKDYFNKEKLLAGERKKTKSELAFHVFMCLLVRFIFIAESSFWIFYTIGLTGRYNLLWIIILLVFMLFDGLYLSIFRHGYEHSWFFVSVFLFTITSLVFIWTTSLIKVTLPSNHCKNVTAELISSNNFYLSNHVSMCTMIEYMVSSFAVTVIIGRFIQPLKRSRITQRMKADMLTEFIFWGSDMVDFFSISDEESIQDDYMVYIILVLFSFSTIQFCFSIVGNSLRPKVSKKTEEPQEESEEQHVDNEHHEVKRAKTEEDIDAEILTLIMSFALQDFPFLLVRLYVLITYTITDYTFFFLLSKNIILCILHAYRLTLIIVHRRRRRKDLVTAKFMLWMRKAKVKKVRPAYA